ncbi:MAG: mechanosensitive ion channel domain-containing protein [Pseudomonadota bacterium]
MPLRPRHLTAVALAFLSLLFTPPVFAQTLSTLDVDVVQQRLDDISDRLETQDVTQNELVDYRESMVRIAEDANACVESTRPERDQLKERLDVFEDLSPDTNAALFDQSIEVRNRFDEAQALLLSCQEFVTDANRLLDDINEKISELAARYLWQRGASLPALISSAPSVISRWPGDIRGGMTPRLDQGTTMTELLWLLMIVGAIAIGAGLVIRYRFNRWFTTHGFDKGPPLLSALFPKPLASHAPMLLLGVGLLITLYTTTTNASMSIAAVRAAFAILMFGVGCVIIDWATGPLSPAGSLAGFYPDHVQPMRRRLRFFVLMLVSSFVILGDAWLGVSMTVDRHALARAIVIIALCLSLWTVISYMGRIRGLVRYRFVRYVGLLCIVVALGAVVFGYRNFASYLTHGAVRTATAIIVIWILLWLVFSVFEALIEGRTPLSRRVRDMISSSDKESRTGFGLMQLSADVIIWLGFAVYLVYVWDSSGVQLDQLQSLAVEGKKIGEIELVPLQLVYGILSFSLLIALTGWIKRLIDKRWLRHMNMDRGARDAMVTLSGYIGFVIAILIALNVAGINLGGLALVGGGLALGIGFGLQAIASNFVSGLILLFERPIKAGDFVTVGETEGFVRRIRIRATDIETLDNQNVLVPNSELVSGRVTNWVLRNPQGRLRIRVGVAYGSDIELVRSIMERVGREHEDVISDGGAPAPRALFMGFGDSALDFELRVRIRRIEKRFSVISDINFVLDREFRDNNITVPFPQRDLHLVNLPESQATLPAAPVRPIEPTTTRDTKIIDEDFDDITRHFKHHITLKCSIERVWTALTDPEQLQRWYCKDVDIAARIGGSFTATLHDDSEVEAVIDVFMPPRRLRMAQLTPDGEGPLPSGPVYEELTLHQDDDTVILTLDVFGIPAEEDWEGYFRRAESHWEASLAELKKLLRVVKDN